MGDVGCEFICWRVRARHAPGCCGHWGRPQFLLHVPSFVLIRVLHVWIQFRERRLACKVPIQVLLHTSDGLPIIREPLPDVVLRLGMRVDVQRLFGVRLRSDHKPHNARPGAHCAHGRRAPLEHPGASFGKGSVRRGSAASTRCPPGGRGQDAVRIRVTDCGQHLCSLLLLLSTPLHPGNPVFDGLFPGRQASGLACRVVMVPSLMLWLLCAGDVHVSGDPGLQLLPSLDRLFVLPLVSVQGGLIYHLVVFIQFTWIVM
mmetsp:Transcript_76748/g.128996  ORF Transcript_76748/g.128996 Transcript_76748/m.128996 type:complete len:259 (-) Transcript_76748:1252-2028(-)